MHFKSDIIVVLVIIFSHWSSLKEMFYILQRLQIIFLLDHKLDTNLLYELLKTKQK